MISNGHIVFWIQCPSCSDRVVIPFQVRTGGSGFEQSFSIPCKRHQFANNADLAYRRRVYEWRRYLREIRNLRKPDEDVWR